MSVIKLLNNGGWNKPPVLAAARKILIDALRRQIPTASLGEMASFINGTSYASDFLSPQGVPIIRISNITDPTSDYLRTVEDFDEKYSVRPGDLLVSWSASFKSVIWPGTAGILNQHIFKVTEKGDNHRGYIRHAIEAVFDEMQEKVVGIGMMHLRRTDFLGQKIPRPETQVQKAVSDFLDWIESPRGREPPLPSFLQNARQIVGRIEQLASGVNEARAFRQQAMEESQALLSNARDNIFSALESDPEVIRPMLGEVARFRTGHAFKSIDYRPEGRLIFRVSNIRANESVDLADSVFLANELESFYADYQLDSGDILMVMVGGSVGKLCIVPPSILPALMNQNMWRINPLDVSELSREFLFHFLHRCNLRLGVGLTQSTHGHLTLGNYKAQRIPLPSLLEQHRIVARLDELQQKIGSLKALQTDTSAELDALMPSILDKAFRGEL